MPTPAAACPSTGRFPIKLLAVIPAALAILVLARPAWPEPAPPTSYPLTPAAKQFRARVYAKEPCLAKIVDVEDGWWDATVDHGGGHGNTAQSYGIPQAYPGTKLQVYTYTVGRHRAGDPTGPDWRTNAVLQLAWMRNYAIGKFGSECAALASRLANGSY